MKLGRALFAAATSDMLHRLLSVSSQFELARPGRRAKANSTRSRRVPAGKGRWPRVFKYLLLLFMGHEVLQLASFANRPFMVISFTLSKSQQSLAGLPGLRPQQGRSHVQFATFCRLHPVIPPKLEQGGLTFSRNSIPSHFGGGLAGS